MSFNVIVCPYKTLWLALCLHCGEANNLALNFYPVFSGFVYKIYVFVIFSYHTVGLRYPHVMYLCVMCIWQNSQKKKKSCQHFITEWFWAKIYFWSCSYSTNHPDVWGPQVQVCIQSLESKLNMEKLRSLNMCHISSLAVSFLIFLFLNLIQSFVSFMSSHLVLMSF